jgi:hypothetical protein
MAPQQLFLPKEEDSKPLINLWIHFGKALECMRDVDPLLRVIDMKGLIRCELQVFLRSYLVLLLFTSRPSGANLA